MQTFQNTADQSWWQFDDDVIVTETGGVYAFCTGTASAVPNANNTGTGTIGAISVTGPGAQLGPFTVTLYSATEFAVTQNGQSAAGTVGQPFAGLGLGFTLPAGGTAFVMGDGFAGQVVSAGALSVPETLQPATLPPPPPPPPVTVYIPAYLVRQRLTAANLWTQAVAAMSPAQIVEFCTLQDGIDPSDAGVIALLTGIGANPSEILAAPG